ncbi:MAG: type II toxin-antitoxin system HicA family toxin [Candidatus Woykebacteria bacterium]
MPRLYSARKIINTLRRAGFLVVSQKGSHVKLRKTIGQNAHSNSSKP